MRKQIASLLVLIPVLILAGCTGNTTVEGTEQAVTTVATVQTETQEATQPAPQGGLTKVTLMLDWVPNVNHTGIFVAQDQGYFTDAGLDVNIVQPGEVYAEQAVASSAADFGISFQEQVTLSHATQDVPLVSLAAIIQHNTSGFASMASKGAKSAKDWEGLTYGSFGSPFETPTLQALMECAGGDFTRLKTVEVGFADPLALLQQGQIDLAWIFYGTQGIAAQQQGIDLNVVMMSDNTDCIPDYYTPILITSEQMIQNKPDVVKAFVGGVSKGYQYAVEHPDESADILLKAAPESDKTTLHAQQEWLSPQYQADTPRWGEQKLEVWQNYSQWMADNGIIDKPIDAQAAFTNKFLP